MKVFTGWVLSAGLLLAATSANTQMLAPEGAGLYTAVSDVYGPYAAMPPDASVPGYDGPRLLPASEVYTVLRENGFSPLGIPRQRGVFYTIAVIDRGGEDGRLVIDARDGRIVRFVSAYRVGSNTDEGLPPVYGRGGPLPPINPPRGSPRPPAPVPHVADRTPSERLPKATLPRAVEPPVAARSNPAPATQSAAMQPKSADRPAEVSKAPQNTAPAPIDAKPAPRIQPTQEMPKAQGLE